MQSLPTVFARLIRSWKIGTGLLGSADLLDRDYSSILDFDLTLLDTP